MKVYSLHAVNDLRYEEVPYPDCPQGWCVVKVKACGICSSDIPRIFKKGTYHFPTIPGHEFSGIVDKASDQENKYLLGKKVGIFPLIPCRKCAQCMDGKYEMCRSYDYIGSRRNGGFAEYVSVPVWNLVELSDEASYVEAAMMEPMAVSLHAIKRMELNKNDDVAIIGTGMIAFAAAQWAISMGVSSVTVLGRSENKRKIAESIDGVTYEIIDQCNKEFDAVLEAVGSQSAIIKSVEIAAPGGRIVLMGNPEGDILFPQDVYWKILRKQISVTGTWNSSYEKDAVSDWKEVKEALETHSIDAKKLVSHIFPQDNMMDALDLMHSHKEPYCKVMTLWNQEEK